MSEVNSKILALLKNKQVDFTTIDNASSPISVEEFEANFSLLAGIKLPNIDKYTYYYQHITKPELIMCIKLTSYKASAVLGSYEYFKDRLEPLLNG